MRIVGGRMRGLKLAAVGAGDPGAHLRPTAERTREALFNLLTNGRWGDLVRGAEVLDLFAGTGALGLEALSRGAARVRFVETGAPALALLAQNIALARAGAEAEVLRRDATALGPNPGPPASLVFLDPPYGTGLGARALAAALAGGWLAPGAAVAWEEGAPAPLPAGLALLDRRRYGAAHLALAQVPPPA